jgi:predicted phosphodiesterase
MPKDRIANWLFSRHPLHSNLPFQPGTLGLKVVCISDTHCQQPVVPPGDILIHAGDLTEDGTFAQYQEQLDWFSSLPHRNKILIGGNHDTILDEAFQEKYGSRQPGKTKADLRWGKVIYLENESATLTVVPRGIGDDPNTNGFAAVDPVTVKIFGSPHTPSHSVASPAFQYTPSEAEAMWRDKIPADTDILVVHGPPHLHLDGWRRAGCPVLAREIAKQKPKLVVFGHIHKSHGQKTVVFDKHQQLYDEISRGSSGKRGVAKLGRMVVWERTKESARPQERSNRKVVGGQMATTMVNASIVGSNHNVLNEPIIVEI